MPTRGLKFEDPSEFLEAIRLSPTKLQNFTNCRRKMILDSRWQTRFDSKAAVLGSVVHMGLYGKIKGEPWRDICVALLNRAKLEPEDRAEIWAKALPAIELWEPPNDWEFMGVEEKFEVELPDIDGVTWAGVIDAEIKIGDEEWVVDYKTGTRPPNADYVRIDDQLLGYYATQKALGGNPQGSIWHAIIFPYLKKKKKEDWDEYSTRVHEAIESNPLECYQKLFVEYSKDQAKQFWGKLYFMIKELRRGAIYRNPSACRYFSCAFSEICNSDASAKLLGFEPRSQEDRPTLNQLATEGTFYSPDKVVLPSHFSKR